MGSTIRWALLCCAVICLPACASKQPVKQGVENAAGAGAGTAGESRRYIVKKGDSLWAIAGKQDVMGDAFRWPLLYRQNRDQIQDPDLIEIRQDLAYRKQYLDAEIQEALRLARETPPFVPHSTPRKSLPLKY